MEQVGQNCHENDEQLANSHSDDSPDISCSSSSSPSHHHHSTPSSTCSSSQTSSTTTFSSSPFTSPSLSNVSFSRNSSNVRLPSSTSLEEMSPTSPEIWLRKQEEHFPPACKKGGSLPRSFESTAFTSSSQFFWRSKKKSERRHEKKEKQGNTINEKPRNMESKAEDI
ncbi:putative protein TPRXL [Tetranychus urticae]|uniref:putative protein TPRXL n=1 Tax=Tetranychus urticae TaxID=32264 RepID=UPI00077BA6AA|nr:putative protein TPRXL [Tetranychus urticae]